MCKLSFSSRTDFPSDLNPGELEDLGRIYKNGVAGGDSGAMGSAAAADELADRYLEGRGYQKVTETYWRHVGWRS